MKGCKIKFMICWKCKREISVENVTRLTECPLCSCDLHCCKGCKFYSAGNHWDCKENIDSIVLDKERSNFCDFFAANKVVKSNDESKEKSNKDNARDLFNSLFY